VTPRRRLNTLIDTKKTYFIIISIDRIARVVNFPRFDMPEPVIEAVDKVNKQNLVINLWEILQEEKEKNETKIEKEKKLNQQRRKSMAEKPKKAGKSKRMKSSRRDSKVISRFNTALM